MNPAANLPLWLDLRVAALYGFMGILPWERVFSQLLERPILRLPDFLERPRENSDVLEAAIVFDPPPSTSPESAAGQIKVIVDEMLAGSPRPQTRIHIFPMQHAEKPWRRSVSTNASLFTSPAKKPRVKPFAKNATIRSATPHGSIG